MNEQGTLQGRGLLPLALVACLVGTLSGLVAALFRLGLQQADRSRDALIGWTHSWPVVGFPLVVVAVAGTTTVAAWLVKRFSVHAAGSGIPHVEAVVNGELPPAPPSLLPVKFFGGWLAIGGGLALGREGPSVQMGASLGSLLGKVFRFNETDSRALLAAGAGAGLATAFNAPVAGAVFVLEELVRRFEARILVAALGASAGAILVARLFLGSAPDFHIEAIPRPGFGAGVLALALGSLTGLAGVAYNRAILGGLALADRFSRWPVEMRAALIGAGVGALAWFAPGWVGGGETLTQLTLSGSEVITLVPMAFAIRFLLGAASYSAGTPGGLFAPMLVLGAQLGLLLGAISHWGFPGLGEPPVAFAVVGMAAFFTAVVRAPLTGIILITEMTGSSTLLFPLLTACFAAMIISNLLGNEPIYDSLKEQQPQLQNGVER